MVLVEVVAVVGEDEVGLDLAFELLEVLLDLGADVREEARRGSSRARRSARPRRRGTRPRSARASLAPLVVRAEDDPVDVGRPGTPRRAGARSRRSRSRCRRSGRRERGRAEAAAVVAASDRQSRAASTASGDSAPRGVALVAPSLPDRPGAFPPRPSSRAAACPSACPSAPRSRRTGRRAAAARRSAAGTAPRRAPRPARCSRRSRAGRRSSRR